MAYAKLVHAVLATRGYRLGVAVKALAAYEANPARIDLVVTDIVMPI
jgi:CheY-like chemotaxis protein